MVATLLLPTHNVVAANDESTSVVQRRIYLYVCLLTPVKFGYMTVPGDQQLIFPWLFITEIILVLTFLGELWI
jgi:hypothetical protein